MGKTVRYDIVKACMDEYNSDQGERKKIAKKYRMPRGNSIPAGKVYDLKSKYNRRKQKICRGDWLEVME